MSRPEKVKRKEGTIHRADERARGMTHEWKLRSVRETEIEDSLPISLTRHSTGVKWMSAFDNYRGSPNEHTFAVQRCVLDRA